ncbi:hypothetical protein HB662_24025 [Roseomonas frigidaquae]|uniref:Calx-beta domain-containing protein n=1 Tax=Falsiroseomonas frigidaquae TaxID=487318 RepID=A0ABX1F6L0_9PROT|nr:Calx-beta domain-containing protein [Falsiroseomonas frigidaquae]NKE47866.1 hypothetical protein [Falsiroseomonas frigidaquae]
MALLINGFGGPAGLGENALAADSRWSFGPIDLSAFYNASSGLKFLGSFHSSLWVNQDGFIQFRPASGDRAELPEIPPQGPGVGVRETIAPILAPFWSPVDTDRTPLPLSEGGTSRGTNMVWYDLDEATGTLVVTWDDVLPTSGGGSEISDAAGRNAFQLVLRPATNPGATSIDFDVTFRYESLEWPSFNFRDNLFFDTVAGRALMTNFATVIDGEVVVTELPPSLAAAEDPQAALDLVTTGNIIGQPGVWHFAYRQGWVTAEISAEDTVVVEGTGPGATFAAVEVRLVAGVQHAVTVTWQAVNQAEGLGYANVEADLLETSGSITFAPGETQKSIFIPINRDAIDEALPLLGFTNETFRLELSTTPVTFLAPGGSILLNDSVVVTITDDDAPVVAGFSVADASATEAAGEMVFTVTRGDASADGRVDYAVTGSSATAGADFTAAIGVLHFLAGETSRTISVAIATDRVVEADEALTLTLSNPIGQDLLQGTATGTILDTTSLITIIPETSPLVEGTEDSTIVYRFIRSGAGLTEAASLGWSFVPGSLSAADFAPGTLFSGTVSFAANQTEASVLLTLAADDLVELEEGGTMVLTASSFTAEAITPLLVQDQPRPPVPELLRGSAAAETLEGAGGADTLVGLDGDDALFGGTGRDSLYGGLGQDSLWGGSGDDRMLGNDGDDVLDGGRGQDLLNGGGGADTILGGDGLDTLVGAAGDDVLSGGDGNDRLYGGDGDDRLEGGGGNNQLFGGAGNDTLLAGDGHMDTVRGEAGDDLLLGSDSRNILVGGEGNDTFEGGLGADVMLGGAGADVFRWTDTSESSVTQRDRITGFVVGEDLLDLSALGGPIGFLGGGAFTAGAAAVRVTQVPGSTIVWFDSADADVQADMAFVLGGSHALSAADFILA